jgi:hypothetical protein
MLIQKPYGVPPNFPLPPSSKMRLRRSLFVSKNGNDSNRGDYKEPWVSVAYAMSQAFPGDTVFMRDGIYETDMDVVDTQRFVVNAGENFGTGAIILAGYPGENIKWLPPSGIFPIRLTYPYKVSYIIFKNFSIDGSNQPDVPDGTPNLIYTSSGCHHCRFQNMDIGNCMIDTIGFSTANVGPYTTAHEVIDCIIHDAGLGTWDSGHGGPGHNNGYGTYDITDGNLYLRNIWKNNCGFTMNIYGSDHLIVGNWLYGNGRRGGSSAAINIGSRAYGDTYPELPERALSKNNKIWNNVAFKNYWNAIQIYTESLNTEAWNNTLYKNGGYGVFSQYNGAARVGNNIAFANQSGEMIEYSPGTIEYITNLQDDPLFVDPENDDYHLKSQSNAINTGTTIDFVERDRDGFQRPQGNAYCIGAYEFRDDNPDPIDPIIPPDNGCCCCCSCSSKRGRRR